MKEGKELKVAEAKQGDIGRGVARIDPEAAYALGVTSGDIVEIEGKRRTAVVLWPGLPADAGGEFIRIDSTTRRNTGVRIDDKVRVRKIDAKPAEKVRLAPTEELRIIGGEDYLKRFLENRALVQGDQIDINVMGRKIDLRVVKVKPKGDALIVTPDTVVELSEKPEEVLESRIPQVAYEDIGGLTNEIQKVREMIELPLKHPELFERLGIEAPKGVLLHGPPGTGKTLLAKAVASETESSFYDISGPEIMSKFYGESEENLRKKFDEAEENAPSIIFIDEIDSIAPKREEVTGEVERRVVAQLLSLMDGLKSRGKVVVIGATNRPNALDSALRRGGRFDREIEIGIPDQKGRLEVLQIHSRGVPLEEGLSLEEVAASTHGFVGADLEALVKEAAMKALRRVLPEMDLEAESIPAEILDKIIVSKKDFLESLSEVEPSALREVFVEVPNVSWDDVGGLEEIKRELRESIEWPLKYTEVFEKLKAKSPKGILLYGPPGTGKTLLAKAVANESEANFISIKGPEFLSKWVGESEKAVRETFRKARQASPTVIFLDELDAVVPARGLGADSHVTERVVSQILTELDGLEELNNVVVIAATNRPDIIDPALLRPGRFDKLIEVPPPGKEAREAIFKIHLEGKPVSKDVSLETLAAGTEGFTGADITAIVNEATALAIREYVDSGEEDLDKALLRKEHFTQALERFRSSREKVSAAALPPMSGEG
ncbi:ATP-dependent zinc metalloprotease FtsH [archaeon BMS3Bbin16]|nr:ATP-dependent zinc metalloprotease FtsH [archaeon BMS3Bbin16]